MRRWQSPESHIVSHLAPWIISVLPVLDKTQVVPTKDLTGLRQFLADRYSKANNDHQIGASLICSYYFGVPWREDEIETLILAYKQKEKARYEEPWIGQLLNRLKSKRISPTPRDSSPS